MDYAERQKRIVEYLRIKSTSHGQIYTFQIAVPNPESVQISPERFEAISRSLKQQGTNFISLLVRRTEAYSEEEEYEVVYGADWCLVAKEIGIEKLWVWVFNMTDEEAQIALQEMELLAGKSEANVPVAIISNSVKPESDKQIELLVKRFEALAEQYFSIVGEIKRLHKQLEDSNERKLENKLGELFSKIEAAITTGQRSTGSSSCLKKDELKSIAKNQGIKILAKYNKAQIIDSIEKAKGIKILPEWSKTRIIDAIEKAG